MATRIDTLELRNYRRFDHIKIVFDPHLTVLTAENGGGKTALLEGAVAAIVYFVDKLCGAAPEGFERTDVRLQLAPGGEVLRTFPTTLVASGNFADRECAWERTLSTTKGKTSVAGATPLRAAAESLRTKLEDWAESTGERPLLPLIAYYGTLRTVSPRRRTRRRDVLSRLNDPTGAYDNCLSPHSDIFEFELWLEAMTREQQQEQATGIPSRHRPAEALAALNKAVQAVLRPTGWSAVGWDFVADAVVATHPRLGRMPMSLLSDGVLNMIAMVADLAHRASRLNRQLGEDACVKAEGIVLIDEVDMHLHPVWQQQIVGTLREAFPLVQFIVTTHSPQVLSTVRAHEIRIIQEDGTIATPTSQTRGVESARLLSELMGVDPIPSVPEAELLANYQGLIEQGEGRSNEALSLREKLVVHFGERHAVLRDCDTMQRFQDAKRKRTA
jgi:predicted ATP-binding protein involved in virulence